MARKAIPAFETEKGVFPVRLKELMEQAPKTSQKMLADVLGVTRQAVANYQCGQSSPSWDAIAKIAKHFNVSADYLLGLSDVATPNADMRAICDYTGLNEKSVYKLHSILEDCQNCRLYFGKDGLSTIDAFLCSDGFVHFVELLVELRDASMGTHSLVKRLKSALIQAEDINEKYNIARLYYDGFYSNVGGFYSDFTGYGGYHSNYDPLLRYRLFDVTEQFKGIVDEICSNKSAQEMYDAAASEVSAITDMYWKEVEKKDGD